MPPLPLRFLSSLTGKEKSLSSERSPRCAEKSRADTLAGSQRAFLEDITSRELLIATGFHEDSLGMQVSQDLKESHCITTGLRGARFTLQPPRKFGSCFVPEGVLLVRILPDRQHAVPRGGVSGNGSR